MRDARLVIFDLDGTLVDSHGAIRETVDLALAARGWPATEPGRVAALVGLPLVTIFEAVCPAGPEEIEALCAEYRRRYAAVADPLTRPFRGVPALLGTLIDRPVRTPVGPERRTLAIATSKSTAGAERVLRAVGLERVFSVVLGIDAVAHPKPAPDMVRLVLERARAQPEHAVVVGDTTYDIEMARAAGVRSIGVTWGAHSAARLEAAGATRVVSDVAELADAFFGRERPC